MKEQKKVLFRVIEWQCEEFDNVIHISHDDLDGKSPIILSHLAFGADKVSSFPLTTDDMKISEIVLQQLDKMTKKTLMVITDISVIWQVAVQIQAKVEDGYRIFLFDHHDTAYFLHQHFNWAWIQGKYEDGRGTAATSMYYDFLLANGFLKSTPILEDYVGLVRWYDTWEWQKAGLLRPKRLNDFFFMGDSEEFMTAVESRLREYPMDEFRFDPHIEYALDKEQKRIDAYMLKKRKHMKLFRSVLDETDRIYTFGICTAEQYQSELGNYLLQVTPEMDFIVMIDPGSMKMSLRSLDEGNVHVGNIAKRFGGGGRKPTAGCPLNTKSKYAFLDRFVFEALVNRE